MGLSAYREYETAYKLLSQSAANGRVAGAYIIEGDNLTDKMGLALNFAKAIMCTEKPGEACDFCNICRKVDHGNYEDIYIIGREDRKSIGVELIRGISEKIKTKPIGLGNRNIVIIDDGDYMTVQAQNVLLKTLEEPPEGTLIIILSENTENLITTIKSRCITVRLYNFRESQDVDGFEALAEKTIEWVQMREPFFRTVENLKKKIKSEKDGMAFLDGMEKVIGRYIMSNDSRYIDREKAKAIIKYVEEAKKDIRYNVGYKYAIKNLIIKIGLDKD